MAVPVGRVMNWLMVSCSGDGSLFGGARPIVSVKSEACFSNIAEVD